MTHVLTDDGSLVITLRAPVAPQSENWARGRHWSVVRKALRPWGEVAWANARNARIRGDWAQDACPINVHVSLPFPTARTRDPHNYVGTVVKAIVDGLVRAHIVPDDNPEWVTVLEPTLEVQQGPQVATITITERRA